MATDSVSQHPGLYYSLLIDKTATLGLKYLRLSDNMGLQNLDSVDEFLTNIST